VIDTRSAALRHCRYAQAFPKVIHRLRTILSTAKRAGKPTPDNDGRDAVAEVAAPFGALQNSELARAAIGAALIPSFDCAQLVVANNKNQGRAR
jgi:hypothetical protein